MRCVWCNFEFLFLGYLRSGLDMLWWNLIVWVSGGLLSLSDWRLNNLGGRGVTFRVTSDQVVPYTAILLRSSLTRTIGSMKVNSAITILSKNLEAVYLRGPCKALGKIVNKGMEKTNQSAYKASYIWKSSKNGHSLTFAKVNNAKPTTNGRKVAFG